MSTPLSKLLPIGFFASLGAPTLYVVFVLLVSTVSGRRVEILLLLSMFGAAFMFSLIATLGLVVITLCFAWLLRIESVNVSVLSIAYLLGISALIAFKYGIDRAMLFAGLALANVLIFIVLSRHVPPSGRS